MSGQKRDGGKAFAGYRLPKLWRFLITWFVFFLLMGYDPIGEGPAKDLALVELANYLGAPFYSESTRAQDQIVIIMADPLSLGELGWTWPLPYDRQAAVVGKILEHKPRLLAMDLLFLDRRENEGFEFLEDTIKDHRDTTAIIGAAAPRHEGFEQPRQILPLSVAAEITVKTEWKEIGYHLLTDDGRSRPSLALAIYEEACRSTASAPNQTIDELCKRGAPFDEDEYEREMLVFWGSGSPDYNRVFDGKLDIADDLFRCKKDSRSAPERVVQLFLRQERSLQETCAFHPVLPLDLLMQLESDALDAALAGKIVIYGLNHPGIPDIVNPPTSQPIAGVHLHAMAVDNLLTFGPDYFGTTTSRLWGVGSLALPTLKFIVALLTFATIFCLMLTEQKREAGDEENSGALPRKTIHDFADLRAAILHWLRGHHPRLVLKDIRLGLKGWNQDRKRRLQATKSAAGATAAWLRWTLGLAPVLIQRSATGRWLLFGCIFVLIFCLDLYVLNVPPINALTLIVILGASQAIVPTEIFRPSREPHDQA